MSSRKVHIERGAAYEITETEGKRIGMTVCNRLNCKALLRHVPAADVVEVVRCEKCAHFRRNQFANSAIDGCMRLGFTPCRPDDYCSYGERKDGADSD